MTSFAAKTIVFLVFPDVKLLDLTGPVQVFSDANLTSSRLYDVRIVSLLGGFVQSDTPMPVETRSIASLEGTQINTVIVAGGSGAFAAAKDDEHIQSVRALAARALRVGSVCTGAFVLAEAGLLNGRNAVTHWDSCDLLRETYSDIKVQKNAIYTNDGNIWTSAGVTAGIDMSLAMVADDIGRKTALELARSLVCYMVRPGGQSQFSGLLQQQTLTASGKFESLNVWITHNLACDLSVETLAEHEGMSPRNFARLYKKHTGTTPAKAVEAFRVDAACQLLEETDLPIQSIAIQCGFMDDERLRRAMMRCRNVAPGEYRQRFGKASVNN